MFDFDFAASFCFGFCVWCAWLLLGCNLADVVGLVLGFVFWFIGFLMFGTLVFWCLLFVFSFCLFASMLLMFVFCTLLCVVL